MSLLVCQITNMFIHLSVTHNKLLVNVFLASSFGCKIEPSSGYNTRTEKREPLKFFFFSVRAKTSCQEYVYR